MRILLCLFGLLLACDESSSPDAGDSSSPDSGGSCTPGDAPFTIDEATIAGRTLTVTVSYSGGCEEHDFVAWWSGALGTSAPPMVPLDLVHYGHGDSCEAALTEDVLIDLGVFDTEPWDEVRLQILPNGNTSGSVEVLYTKSPGTPPTDGALAIDTSCGTTGS